ncbi:hypothetical protein JXR93_09840 [bacterium]|nr:hypothetical protein [bacterium]
MKKTIVLSLFIFAFIACGKPTEKRVNRVNRIDSNESINLSKSSKKIKCTNPRKSGETLFSGDWSKSDSDEIVERISEEILSFDFKNAKTIQIEKIENKAKEHISGQEILMNLQKNLMDNSSLQFRASNKDADMFRKEIGESDSNKEIKADLTVFGEITLEESTKKIDEYTQKLTKTYRLKLTFKDKNGKIIFEPTTDVIHNCEIFNKK